jgi:quinol monooxygenase YgiN
MAEPVTVGLLVRIEALPGRESDVENFLQHGLTLVEQEPGTVRWFAVRFGPSSFGIYDAFRDDSGRQAHLSGQVAQALAENTGDLFAQPTIEPLDVIAEKPPI